MLSFEGRQRELHLGSVLAAADAGAASVSCHPAEDRGAHTEPVLRHVVDLEAVAAVARTFGALKPRTPAPVVNPTAAFPAHNDRPEVLTHDGADTQAAAVIAWPTGGGTADIAESRRLDILSAIFGDRLFDRLRSVAGASYSPSAVSQWPLGLQAGGRLMAVGQFAV